MSLKKGETIFRMSPEERLKLASNALAELKQMHIENTGWLVLHTY